jgi:hypothetical protein
MMAQYNGIELDVISSRIIARTHNKEAKCCRSSGTNLER